MINGIEDFTEGEQDIITSLSNTSKQDFKYRMCCVGSMSIRKGQKIILEALTCMDKLLLEDMHITFVGDGSDRRALERFVVINKLSRNVEFVGAVDNSIVYQYLCKANIYILMSKNEGLAISIIEAMRAGLAIISTNISGTPELVDNGRNGVLLEPNSEQLTDLFNNMDKYNWVQMGKESRMRFSEEFLFDRMKRDYAKMLDKTSVGLVIK